MLHLVTLLRLHYIEVNPVKRQRKSSMRTAPTRPVMHRTCTDGQRSASCGAELCEEIQFVFTTNIECIVSARHFELGPHQKTVAMEAEAVPKLSRFSL